MKGKAMPIFEAMPDYVGTSETVEHDGFRLAVRLEYDCDHGTPWEECDGHGPVSEWTTRAKLSGELELCRDRSHRRFYDFAEACRIARRDGWNAAPYVVAGETARQKAARAARADFERLRAWCTDEWHWLGVVVTASRNGIELGRDSLWGIESDAGEYLREVADDLAAQAIAEAREALADLCECVEV